MKLKYSFFALIGSIFVFSACIDDKGSYGGITVNEITVSGLEKNYSVMAGITELNITPSIEGTVLKDDDSQYKYTWYACKTEIGKDEHQHFALGNERNLNTIIELAPGTYKLYLLINDTSTGQEWIISDMTLSVSTPLATGFYVFGDKEDGTVGMDFLSTPATEGDTTMVYNIFNNEQQLRGAEDLIYTGDNTSASSVINLWAVTESGSYKITNSIQESSVFEIDQTYDEASTFITNFDITRPIKILDQFPHQRAGGAAAKTGERGYMTEEGVYVASFNSLESFPNPINRNSVQETKLFKCYKNPFYLANQYTISLIVLYDMDNNRFVQVDGSSPFGATNCKTLTDKGTDRYPWDQNQVKRTIVYGENTPAYYSYALMKDIENNENFHVYQMYVYRSSPQKYNAISFTTAQAIDLDKATHYAFLGDYTVLLYAVGNKLYKYNYAEGSCELLKEYDAEITYLAMEWVSRNNNGDIAVCTYNPDVEASQRGTIYKYNMGQTLKLEPIMTGPNLDKEFVYHSPLKIKKLEFRSSYR